jgi:hypothetical protein
MASTLEKWPTWAERALQGIAYWIGHRRCLYRHYPLSEGALVAEVCNLIHANLPDKLSLSCEVQYSSLIHRDEKPTELTDRARADLVVAEKAINPDDEATPKFIIEVKWASAPKAQIDADLRRLSAVRGIRPDLRTFLFVISEAQRPARFVGENGMSVLGKHPIPQSEGHFRVRRTWKAAHAYTKRDRAQYACLIEVYPPQTLTLQSTRTLRDKAAQRR